MRDSVSYAEFCPNGPLSNFVECFWSLDVCFTSGVLIHRAFPDGCVDVVVDANGTTYISGAMTTASTWPLDARRPLLGARIRPGWAPHVFGISATELRDRVVALDLIKGPSARAWGSRVQERPGRKDQIRVLKELLASHLPEAYPAAPLIIYSLERLSRPAGASEVHALARAHSASASVISEEPSSTMLASAPSALRESCDSSDCWIDCASAGCRRGQPWRNRMAMRISPI